jgi:hypothetical protein
VVPMGIANFGWCRVAGEETKRQGQTQGCYWVARNREKDIGNVNAGHSWEKMLSLQTLALLDFIGVRLVS